MWSELGTLEWNTINPDCLIRISTVDTFDFLLNPLFFGYSAKNKNRFFKIKSTSRAGNFWMVEFGIKA